MASLLSSGAVRGGLDLGSVRAGLDLLLPPPPPPPPLHQTTTPWPPLEMKSRNRRLRWTSGAEDGYIDGYVEEVNLGTFPYHSHSPNGHPPPLKNNFAGKERGQMNGGWYPPSPIS